MMISAKMNKALNQQITAEFGAVHAYLAMACRFNGMGLKILAAKFFVQADEEREHAMKIVRYVLEVGGTVTLDAIPKPAGQFDDVKSIVGAALESEKNITERINTLVGLAESEKDYATRSFLQWFVDEQVEEVSSMTDLLTLVEMAGDNVLQVEARVRHDMMAPGA